MAKSLLFSPIRIRDLTLRNRVVLAPMCQYSAIDGIAGDWHLVHLGKFATGGMGLVMTEASAIEARGRLSHGDLGIWSDAHIPGLQRVTTFIRSQGAAAGIQLAHAGRKASSQRPWHGHGHLGGVDIFQRAERAWERVSVTSEPYFEDDVLPAELDSAEIGHIVSRFAAAASRADAAGFDVVEIHAAHGYLIASFLSPVVNKRADGYGSNLTGRMRFALEVAESVRKRWPPNKPLFFRISAVDGADNGWTLADSVVLGKELKRLGVDVIDCSSGGIGGSATLASRSRDPGFQVPFAAAIRRHCAIQSMAVGLILDGLQAEAILQAGDADLIAIGREALFDPYWALHAQHALNPDGGFDGWVQQSGWWLERRARSQKARIDATRADPE